MTRLAGCGALIAVLAAGCRPVGSPALITIEDPSGAARTADRVEIWEASAPGRRVVRETDGRPLPLTFVFDGAPGRHELRVEALDGARRLAGGGGVVIVRAEGLSAGTIELTRRCQEDLECDDGLFCTGAERCRDELCVSGNPPCEPGERACVETECDEARDSCAVDVDPALVDGDPCTLSVCGAQGPVQVMVEDGAPCTPEFTAGRGGTCLSGRCEPSVCGDERIDPHAGETCDSGPPVPACVDCQRRLRRISVAADGRELGEGGTLSAASRSGRWLAYATSASPEATGHGAPIFAGAGERLAVLVDLEADTARNLGMVEVHAIAASGLVLASDGEALALLDPLRGTMRTMARPPGLRDAALSADGRTVALALGERAPVLLWPAPFTTSRPLEPAVFADRVSISADGDTVAVVDERRAVGAVLDLAAETSTSLRPAGSGPQLPLRGPVFVSADGDAVAFATEEDGTQAWLWRRGEGVTNQGLGQPCAIAGAVGRLALAHDFALWTQGFGGADRARLSFAPDGRSVPQASEACAMPDDGRFVAFHSAIPIYVDGDGNAARDVFVLSL